MIGMRSTTIFIYIPICYFMSMMPNLNRIKRFMNMSLIVNFCSFDLGIHSELATHESGGLAECR